MLSNIKTVLCSWVYCYQLQVNWLQSSFIRTIWKANMHHFSARFMTFYNLDKMHLQSSFKCNLMLFKNLIVRKTKDLTKVYEQIVDFNYITNIFIWQWNRCNMCCKTFCQWLISSQTNIMWLDISFNQEDAQTYNEWNFEVWLL